MGTARASQLPVLPTCAPGAPSSPWVQGKGIDTDWPSYIEQFAGWLAAAFPAARPTMVNKAQSGSTSNIFDACAEAMVPKARARG